MFTASHNPARYNGIKLCRAGASPVGQDTGLDEIAALLDQGPGAAAAAEPSERPGTVSQQDVLEDYAGYLRGLVDLSGVRPLSVVVDAANGMAGHTVPAVLGPLPIEVAPALLRARRHLPQPRGQPAGPGQPRQDLQREVSNLGRVDAGLAFDGDADRVFLVDERGEAVSPSAITALVATRELAKEPGGTVIHNLITSRAVPEIVTEAGGAAGAHPRGPLLHQGDDGADRRDLRRRALGALLLPRLLPRRLRDAGRAARAGRARRAGQARSRSSWRGTRATPRRAR